MSRQSSRPKLEEKRASEKVSCFDGSGLSFYSAIASVLAIMLAYVAMCSTIEGHCPKF